MFWQFGKLQPPCMCNSSVKHVFLWPSQHTCQYGGNLGIIFQPGNTPMPRSVVPSKKAVQLFVLQMLVHYPRNHFAGWWFRVVPLVWELESTRGHLKSLLHTVSFFRAVCHVAGWGITWAEQLVKKILESRICCYRQCLRWVAQHPISTCSLKKKERKRKGRLFLGHLACRGFSAWQLSAWRK